MAQSITQSRRFVDEVTSGDPRRALEALVERLAVELDQAEGARNVAALVKVLLAVFRAIEGLPKLAGRSLEDELKDRRSGSGRAAGEPAGGPRERGVSAPGTQKPVIAGWFDGKTFGNRNEGCQWPIRPPISSGFVKRSADAWPAGAKVSSSSPMTGSGYAI